MNVVDLPLNQLREAPWNPNQMDGVTLARLRESIQRYGLVENLVVRPLGEATYEVLNGNQRLRVVCEMGFKTVPCAVVNLDDAQAMLLSQALNRIQGEDDLGLRAALLARVLESLPEEQVLSLLPETSESLKALSTMGTETIAAHLQNWQQAQTAKLKHMQFQFVTKEQALVEQALAVALKEVKGKADNPNTRGRALTIICEAYLKSKHLYTAYRRRT